MVDVVPRRLSWWGDFGANEGDVPSPRADTTFFSFFFVRWEHVETILRNLVVFGAWSQYGRF